MMKHRVRNLLFIGGIVAILLMALEPRIPGLFANGRLTLAFISYVNKLELDGLTEFKEISVAGSEPFIILLKPDTPEITQQDEQNVAEIALHAVTVFESIDNLQDDDIAIAFQRPVGQKIILLNRPEMPEALTYSGLIYGELTLSGVSGSFTSLINLAGYRRNGSSEEYAHSQAIVQAICVAYTANFVDDDPICNIISANAAAAWSEMDQLQAADIITGYGMTQLDYLGSRDYRYRFIQVVYDKFRR